jgi:hypothetical protein
VSHTADQVTYSLQDLLSLGDGRHELGENIVSGHA